MNFDLSSIPLFSGLSDESLAHLSGHIQHQQYTRNAIIFNEGDQSDSLYIVNQGKIKIYISNNEGQDMLLKTLGPGDYFGELALIDQEPRTASAKTQCDCHVSVISSENMLMCLERHPEMSISLLQVVVKLLRDATDLQKQLGLMDVYGRLRATLLKLSDDCNGVQKLEPKPTQQELASRIGASREMVSRLLKDLNIGGYIDYDRTSIIIRKKLPEKW